MYWQDFMLFFLGGGAGALLRGGLCSLTPYGVVIVNLLGCFLIGFISQKWGASQLIKTAVVTGFLGGFTTFSSFASEALMLWKAQGLLASSLYVFVQVVAGIVLVCWGAVLAH